MDEKVPISLFTELESLILLLKILVTDIATYGYLEKLVP
jgi:hypothetical protein